MYLRIGSIVSSVALLFASASATATNLIENPDFDSGTSHWALTAGSGTFAIDNTVGSPSVPALHLVSTSPPGSAASSDCVAVQTAQTVDFYVNVLAHSGLISASVSAYGDAGCTNHLGDLSTEALRGGDGAAWTTLSILGAALPAGTHSARVALVTSYSGAGGGAGDAHFDHVRLGATGTTPVTLQTFDVD